MAKYNGMKEDKGLWELLKRIEDGKYTYDLPELNRWDFHYVFVYGTLKKNKVNHSLLLDSKSEFVEYGFTEPSNLVMYGAGSFPVVIQYKDPPYIPSKQSSDGITDMIEMPPARVLGEIWKVSPHTMKALDTLETNGVSYVRHRMNILSSCTGKDVIPCWVYLGRNEFWDKVSKLDRQPLMKATSNSVYPYFTW